MGRLIWAAWTVMLLLWPGPAWAADCPRPIRVAFYDMGILYNPQSGGGLDQEVVEEVFRRIGCRYEVDFQSRVRIWDQLAHGELDMTVSGIPTPERRAFAHFIPYFHVRNQLVSLQRNPPLSSPERVAQQADFRLGVVKSYRHGPGWDEWIERLRVQGRVDEAPDTLTLVRLLQGGRIQAFPALPPLIADLGRRYALDPAQVRQTHWFLAQPKIEHALVLSKTRLSPALVEAMAQAVGQMRHDGTLLRIYRHYFEAAQARDMLLVR